MPRLAIVIPCPGDVQLFEDTLVSVLQHHPPDCQVLVVHAEPYADPYKLADEVTFLHVAGAAHLPTLINRGATAASADVVHVVGCGVLATDGWTAAAVRHFADEQVACVAPLVVSRTEPARLLTAGVGWTWGGGEENVGTGLERSRAARLAPRILGPHWRAAFYRRETLLALGGLDESLTAEGAELDLALALRALDYSVESESGCVLLASEDRVAVPADHLERLYWRHRQSGNWGDLLAGHPLCLVAHAVRHGAGSLAGRVKGVLSGGERAAHQTRLQLARERLAGEGLVVLPFPSEHKHAAAPLRKAA